MNKQFRVWQIQKEKLNERNTQNLYFNQKEIWWCSIGCNIGTEIDGKHKYFERPVLILKKVNRHQFIGIPLTTKLKNNANIYELRISTGSYLVCSQIRSLSSKRLRRKLIRVSTKEFNLIRDTVKLLI
jgi:mRNA interferase MazF